MQDFSRLMKQAQQMQEQMRKVQEELAQQQVEGSAGGGMVTVTMNGRHEVLRVKIDPEVVSPDDVEMLEDLLAAACNDAGTKLEARVREQMGKLTGGLGIPGLS